MIMRNGSGKDYRTLDVYVSSWLILQGFNPTLENEGSKIVFSFSSSEKLFEAISRFNNGATVEVAKFVLTVKNLKAQIFSQKR